MQHMKTWRPRERPLGRAAPSQGRASRWGSPAALKHRGRLAGLAHGVQLAL